jgi:hypothetical protein
MPLVRDRHDGITFIKRLKVRLGIKVMQSCHNWKFPPKVFNSFCPEKMNNIKAVWKLAEAFDGFPNGKLRASDSFYPRIVFCDLVSKVSYNPIL